MNKLISKSLHYNHIFYTFLSFYSQHAGLFGENGANLSHLVAVIAQVFHLEITKKESELHNRLKSCIASLQVIYDMLISAYTCASSIIYNDLYILLSLSLLSHTGQILT